MEIKKFSTNRKTFNMFSFKDVAEKHGFKDKRWKGEKCTYRVYIEGKRDETRLMATTTFTSGIELNTGDIQDKLAELAANNPDSYFVFEILDYSGDASDE